MGNSGLRKIFFPGDIVENKYNTIHELNVIDLDKKEVPLSQYKDKVCLVVNVSSQSIDSPTELAQLKELHSKYAPLGFEILAFPSNQFSNEPGNYKQVKECYEKQYGVPFPVFAKV
jgi:Glutathione peroxidase